MNDAMSFGVHRLWKDTYVKRLNPKGGIRCLDVAGGTGSSLLSVYHNEVMYRSCGRTGDIALRILDHAKDKHSDRDVHVQVLDINKEMLAEGQKRFARTMYHGGPFADHRFEVCLLSITGRAGPQISFTHGNAEDLSTIPSESIDQYTIAFGIRNCTHIDQVLREAYRVLKPGGVFSCLEFSKVTNPILAKCASTSPCFLILDTDGN